MKTFTSLTILSILVLGAITGTVALNAQQAYAPRTCAGCLISEFKKDTHEFEKSVIIALDNPDTTQADIRELHKVWEDGLLRILPTDPVLVGLLQTYEDDIIFLFEDPFPLPGKQGLHDQIKEFKQLTKDFEGAVAAAIIAATQDN